MHSDSKMFFTKFCCWTLCSLTYWLQRLNKCCLLKLR